MSSKQREDSSITISLADIPVCVCCEDASLLEQIRNRYKLYEVNGEGAHRLSLSIVHEVHGSAGEEIELAESGLSITQPTFKGVIDYTSNSSFAGTCAGACARRPGIFLAAGVRVPGLPGGRILDPQRGRGEAGKRLPVPGSLGERKIDSSGIFCPIYGAQR